MDPKFCSQSFADSFKICEGFVLDLAQDCFMIAASLPFRYCSFNRLGSRRLQLRLLLFSLKGIRCSLSLSLSVCVFSCYVCLYSFVFLGSFELFRSIWLSTMIFPSSTLVPVNLSLIVRCICTGLEGRKGKFSNCSIMEFKFIC
jgi:hypothetical protein